MNLYVGNLAPEVSEEDLLSIFGQCGEVTAVKIVKAEPSGEPRGFGFVRFDSRQDAQRAIVNLNGEDLKGRPLQVNQARKGRDDRRKSKKRGSRGKYKGPERRKGNRRADRRKGHINIGRTRDEEDKLSR